MLGALDAAGESHIPILSESDNRSRLAMTDPEHTDNGHTGASYGSPPWQGAAALQMAVDSLDGGQKLEHIIDVGYPYLTQQEIKPCENGTLEDMQAAATRSRAPGSRPYSWLTGTTRSRRRT